MKAMIGYLLLALAVALLAYGLVSGHPTVAIGAAVVAVGVIALASARRERGLK